MDSLDEIIFLNSLNKHMVTPTTQGNGKKQKLSQSSFLSPSNTKPFFLFLSQHRLILQSLLRRYPLLRLLDIISKERHSRMIVLIMKRWKCCAVSYQQSDERRIFPPALKQALKPPAL
jgi:hypothetical protein